MSGPGPDLARAAALFAVRTFQAPDLPLTFAVALPTEAARRLPGFPAAALPEAGRIGSGRGLSAASATRRALGEAAELASACGWGDEPAMRGHGSEFGPDGLDPLDLWGLSKAQLAHRTAWNARWGAVDPWSGPPSGGDEAWLAGRDPWTGRAVHAPAWAVLIGSAPSGPGGMTDSAGCASGSTGDAAERAALLELVERDATGRWWWGDAPARRLPIETLEGCPTLLSAFRARARHRITTLLALASPTGVPCAGGVSHDPDGGRVGLGFAAGATFREAAVAASRELGDAEFRLRLAAAADPGAAIHRWIAGASVRDPRFRAGPAAVDLDRPVDVHEALWRAGVRLALFDLSREAIGARVVRALAPALTAQKPRFRSLPAGDARIAALPGSDATGPADLPLIV